MKLILASNSPRRKELLSKLGYPFEIIPSDCEEISTAVRPQDVVCELACAKASAVFSRNTDCVVLGCDTVVDLDGRILGKPADRADAIAMLTALSGKTHLVHTGVSVISPVGVWLFCESTSVTFRRLTEREIVRYVDGGYADGKAGAYGIQDCDFVSDYNGDFDNVVGMPVYKVKQILDTIYKG